MAEHNGMIERLLESCVRGDRTTARAIMARSEEQTDTIQEIVQHLLWPTYLQLDEQFRADLVGQLEFRVATRLLKSFVHQIALAYDANPPLGRSAFILSGPEESDEIAGQMVADLLEAAGYTVVFAGGGIANDEILERVQTAAPDAIVIFASAAPDLPRIRTLVDTINSIGAIQHTQIVLGGGVFARASGLAEEVGADLWADDPFELVENMLDEPERKMDPSQRTVGTVANPPRTTGVSRKAA